MNKSHTAYSVLELALIPQGKTVKQTLNDALEAARVAEAANYTRYWFAEHHNSANIGSSAPAILIGYVADNTERIRVGAGGVMLPNHSPLIVAEQFGTLAHLYPGRIDLGLGRAPGTDRATAQAIRSDFMQAAQSFPHEVEKLQQYFSADNAHAPVRAGIAEGTDTTLYILGSSTDSAHLAASKGLPYSFASHFATTHLFQALKIYHDEFQPSEFLQKPYTIVGINALVADSDAEAERLFTTLIRMFLGVLTGNTNAGLHPPTDLTPDLREVLQHPTLHQMLKYSFVGSKETVKAQLQQFLDQTRADELIVVSSTFDHADRIKSIQLFAEVMAEINTEKEALSESPS